MATVELSGIRKSYGSAEVIHGVDLAVAEGEMLVLVGPSGCGKSTLLRMIAGLEPITAGELRIGDVRVNEARPRDRNIAMVFQNYALYPHMTVRQNIDLNMRIAGIGRAEIARRVAHAAQLLEIEELLDRKPAQLSGGQRQRVAMGRAIVRDPSVFLFDEPLSNLDAKLRVQMRSEIKTLHEMVKTTSIYVTHDQIEAMTLADRVVVMNDGRIEQIGAPIELYRTPQNLFVASFIGSPAMNILDAAAGDGGQARLGSGNMLALPPCGSVSERTPLKIGIRPEDIKVGSSGSLTARVGLVEPTGAQTILKTHLGAEPVVVVVGDYEPHRLGDDLRLHFPVDRLHVFDAGTGQRLNNDQETLRVGT